LHTAVLVDIPICSRHDRIYDFRGRILDKMLVGGGGCSIWDATGDLDEAEYPGCRLGVDGGEPWGRSGRWRISLLPLCRRPRTSAAGDPSGDDSVGGRGYAGMEAARGGEAGEFFPGSCSPSCHRGHAASMPKRWLCERCAATGGGAATAGRGERD
jgi:hypothetical protein